MTTPIAGLPEISESQASKAITHNQALRQLEINFGAIISRSLTTPPNSPTEGALYIPATGATGLWTGHSNKIVQWANGGWNIYQPFQYQRVFSIIDNAFLQYSGSAWVVLALADMVKTIYDTNNNGIVDSAESISGNPNSLQYYGTPTGGTTKGFYNFPVDFISGHIELAAVKTYTLDYSAKRAYTIKNISILATDGSATASLQINGVNVTGLSNLSISITPVNATATANNIVSIGNRVDLVISANSNASNIVFTIEI